MPKKTDDLVLWKKYQRESVLPKISIECLCVKNSYTDKYIEQWYIIDRNVTYTTLELSDPTVSSVAPVTSPDQSSNFQVKCLRLVLSDGTGIRQNSINMDSAILLLCKLSV